MKKTQQVKKNEAIINSKKTLYRKRNFIVVYLSNEEKVSCHNKVNIEY